MKPPSSEQQFAPSDYNADGEGDIEAVQRDIENQAEKEELSAIKIQRAYREKQN